MKKPDYYASAELHDYAGLIVAVIRVHVVGTPPGVIIWGNRTFAQSFPAMRYNETQSYLVPIEHMHAGAVKPGESPAGKVEP